MPIRTIFLGLWLQIALGWTDIFKVCSLETCPFELYFFGVWLQIRCHGYCKRFNRYEG